MKSLAALAFKLLLALPLRAAEVTVELRKEVIRPEQFFHTHPDHVIPEDMVIQHFKVLLTPKVSGASGPFTFRYDLVEKQGDAKLLGKQNIGKLHVESRQMFLADACGPNRIQLTVADVDGKELAQTTETITCHFSRSTLAGGRIDQLDPEFTGKEYIAGKIEGDKLIYPGLRFFPSDKSRVDPAAPGGKHGFYLTKEPRIYYLEKSGTLVASYHAQVKGRNDAPPGLTVVVTRSTDGGKTWIDDQIIAQHHNAIWGYTAFAETSEEIHMYISGGHSATKSADEAKGVYRCISTDDGKTWSMPQPMDEMTKLVNGAPNTIGPEQSLICNTLKVPNMTWKGKTGDAILVPFYIWPDKILITLDEGKTWDMFFDFGEHKGYEKFANEISWDLLDNRTIYIVSRRQSKSGFKNEMIIDLEGQPTFLGQTRQNFTAQRCHHGSIKIPQGDAKGRVMFVGPGKSDRENGVLALSTDPSAEKFETRALTTVAGFGYCDIAYDRKRDALVVVAESEPFREKTEEVVHIKGAPDRNERFSCQAFSFTLDFYQSLVVVRTPPVTE